MKKYLLLILGLLIFTCSDDSSSTDPSGDNTGDNTGGNNNEPPEIEITGQWYISGTSRSTADYFNKRKNNNIKSVISTNNSLDVGVVSIDSPITGELTATETITVTIGNFGTEEASNFDLLYKIAYGDEDYGDDIT